MGLVDRIKGSTSEVLEQGQAQVMQWLDEYKRAAAALETYGFKAGGFTIAMGLLPEVRTSFVGAVEAIQVDKLQALAASKPDEKLLGALVKALVLSRKLHDHVDLKLKDVTLNVTLGVSPKIDVETH